MAPGVRPVAGLVSSAPSFVRERGDEAITGAGDRLDEAGAPIVVLQLDSQASDMAVDDIALGDEVGSPNGVEDLVAGDDAAGSARQKVEQALLDAAQMHDGIPGVHL